MTFDPERFFGSAEIARDLVVEQSKAQELAQERLGGLGGYLGYEFGDAVWTDSVEPSHKSYESRVRKVINAIVFGEGPNIDKGTRVEIEAAVRRSKIGDAAYAVIDKLVGKKETSDAEYFWRLEKAAWHAVLKGEGQIDEADRHFLEDKFRVELEYEIEKLRYVKSAEDARAALTRAADYAAQYRILFGVHDGTKTKDGSELPLPIEDYDYLKSLIRAEIVQCLANRRNIHPTLDNARMVQSNYDPNLLADYRIINAHRFNFTPNGMEVIDTPPLRGESEA